MKLMQKFIVFVIGTLFTASILPMDQPQKYFKKQGKKIYRKGQRAVQWVENVGQIMLENLSPSVESLTNNDVRKVFMHLPKDIQNQITRLLIEFDSAQDVSIAADAITKLSWLNNDLFELINKSSFNDELISHVSHKFGVDEDFVQKLKDQRDRNYLDLRNRFTQLTEKYLLLNDRGSKEAIKVLRELDAFFANNIPTLNYIVVNQKGIDGSLPLLRAIAKQDVPLVKMLLKAGASPSIENDLPMKKAEAIGNPAIIHLLKDANSKNAILMIEY